MPPGPQGERGGFHTRLRRGSHPAPAAAESRAAAGGRKNHEPAYSPKGQ